MEILTAETCGKQHERVKFSGLPPRESRLGPCLARPWSGVTTTYMKNWLTKFKDLPSVFRFASMFSFSLCSPGMRVNNVSTMGHLDGKNQLNK